MVQRTFYAFDNESMTIDASSPIGSMGDPILNHAGSQTGSIFVFNGGFLPEQITLEDTSSDTDMFDDDELSDHQITDGGSLIANGTYVESESYHYLRALDSYGNPTGPVITITVFSKGGDNYDVWGMATDTPLTVGTLYQKSSGSIHGDSPYASFVACFARGTLVKTPDGRVPVEDICIGDRVWTSEEPNACVKWVGSFQASAQGKMAPVVFAPGSVGNTEQLVVTPQHRMLVEGFSTEYLFGRERVLVSAKHLVGLKGVTWGEDRAITYHHIMFENHRIMEAGGTLSESFHPGKFTVSALEKPVRDELFAMFPELDNDLGSYGPTAEYCLKSPEAQVLLSQI